MLGQISNAGETPIQFDMPTRSTVTCKGAKDAKELSTGNERSRFTAMLACTKEKFPRDVIARVHNKQCMDNKLVLEWVRLVWNGWPGALMQ